MSIFPRAISGAVLCALVLGTSVFAQPAISPLGEPTDQSAPAELSERDIRRLNYYSAQTIEALQGFGASLEFEGRLGDLRQKVQRLMDAGQRSGMDIEATAAYFETYISENSTTPMPGALLDATGRFDTLGLLVSVENFYQNAAPVVYDFTASDEADMAAVRSVAKGGTQPGSEAETVPQVAETLPVITPQTPIISPDAPADVRAILERVRLRGEDWVITVIRGDSLGQFAGALYGDRLLFQRIFEANRGVLSRPNTISIGQELVLPKR